MPLPDSLVRLKQMSNPEVSGYVVSIIKQYLTTGSVTGVAANTGQLTGAFYPLKSNPSCYATNTQLTGYVTKTELSGNNINVLANVSQNYYPRSNPSGYITGLEGTMSRGLNEFSTSDPWILFDIPNGIRVIEYGPDDYFFIRSVNGNATINLTPSQVSISGFPIYTTSINGKTPAYASDLTGYVPWYVFTKSGNLGFDGLDYIWADTTNAGTLLYDANTNFYLKGARAGAPSEKYVIDMYGKMAGGPAPTGRPYIYGFDIYGNQIFGSGGYRVLTTNDLSGIALSGSGTAADLTYVVKTTGNQNISGLKTFINGLTATNSINSPSRILVNSSGQTSIDWQQRWLSTRFFLGNDYPSIDWGTRYLYDAIVQPALQWNTRTLIQSDGVTTSLNWNSRYLTGGWLAESLKISGQNVVISGQTGQFASTGYVETNYYPRNNPSGFITGVAADATFVRTTGEQSISGGKTFQNLKALTVTGSGIYDNGGNLRVNLTNSAFNMYDWNSTNYILNRSLYDAGGAESVDWNNRYLYDQNLIRSIDWVNRNLYNEDDNLVGDWTYGQLYSTDVGLPSIDWTLRVLQHSNGQTSLNWNQNYLTGNWFAQNLTISGFPVVTSNQTGNFANSGYVVQNFYPLKSNPSGYITSAQAGGVQSFHVSGIYLSGVIGISGTKGISVRTGLNNTIIFDGFSDYLQVNSIGAFNSGKYDTLVNILNQQLISVDYVLDYSGLPILDASGNGLSAYSGVSLDWTNRILYGNWSTQNSLTISGYRALTLADTQDFATVNFTNTGFYPRSNPSGYITASQAGGVQSLTVNGGNISGVVLFSGLNGISISSGTNTIFWNPDNSFIRNTGSQNVSGTKNYYDFVTFNSGLQSQGNTSFNINGGSLSITNGLSGPYFWVGPLSGYLASNSGPTMNWWNRTLFGAWSINNSLTISGFRAITSADISGYITTGQTGAFGGSANLTNVTFTTGNQIISGVKTFANRQAFGTGFDISGDTMFSGRMSQGLVAKASGIYSHAEGAVTQALGGYSHAEGIFSISSGLYSHTEGNSNISIGSSAHAEGLQTIASGHVSHTEGQETITFGDYSHAEGYQTTGFGFNSHSEGYQTYASGVASHTAGLGTIALGDYQNVVGQYNVPSTGGLFIVGNGTDANNRSDMFRVSVTGVTITGFRVLTTADSSSSIDTGQFYPRNTNPSGYLNLNTYRAANTGIGNLSTSQVVIFSSPLPSTNYAVTLSFNTTLSSAVSASASSKTISGFTINLNAGIAGGANLDYLAILYN